MDYTLNLKAPITAAPTEEEKAKGLGAPTSKSTVEDTPNVFSRFAAAFTQAGGALSAPQAYKASSDPSALYSRAEFMLKQKQEEIDLEEEARRSAEEHALITREGQFLKEAATGLGIMSRPEKTPRLRPGSDEFIEGALNTIMESEGGFQQDKDDTGNYVDGKLIGTNRGITPAALAKARGVPAKSITVEDMKSITDREARDIYIDTYYYKPKIDRLPTELQDSVFDMQINAGNNAIKILQRLAGVEADGVLGPESLDAIKNAGITREQYANARIDYYKNVAKNNPKKRKFLDGWINRAMKYMD